MPDNILIADPPPEVAAPVTIIIVKKKKKGHGPHHGGAWKVAYADFVTAMMALFIVLWLLSSSADVKKAVGGYFQDPTGIGRLVGSGLAGTGEALSVTKDDMAKLKEKLSQAIKRAPELKKLESQVEMIVTGEGLRIELLESDKGVFFESGRPQPTEMGRGMISMLASELGKLSNNLLVEGHTDAKPFAMTGEYGNFELSADRTNAARRLMEESGLRTGQVVQIRGFADHNLRKPKLPEDPSNRRVSVIVQYQAVPEPPEKPEAKKVAGKEGENAKKKPTK
jgi:chemotaxis protein MotB